MPNMAALWPGPSRINVDVELSIRKNVRSRNFEFLPRGEINGVKGQIWDGRYGTLNEGVGCSYLQGT